jgi:ElaB/YqjD/DUF883 family membrane-anchored ribosome-binding protein
MTLSCSPATLLPLHPSHLAARLQFESFAAETTEDARRKAAEEVAATRAVLEREYSDALRREAARANEAAQDSWREHYKSALLEATARMGREAEGRLQVRSRAMLNACLLRVHASPHAVCMGLSPGVGVVAVQGAP